MNIVILDGYTTNPGDVSWDELARRGQLTCYDYTEPGELVSRAADAEILINNKCVFTREILQQLPKLKYIGLLSTGFNTIDIDAARELGIVVSNVPAYSTGLVAQHTFALILERFNHVALHSLSVRDGQWSAGQNFCYWNAPLSELQGKTLGILGFGSIGRAVAQRALAFDMRVIAYNRSPFTFPGVEQVDLNTLLTQSDVLTLHCPLNEGTRGIINRETLRRMKPTAMLINTSRGGAVVDEDLAEALNTGIIAAAGLDVLGTEPPAASNPLLTAKNCIITPHIAWAATETRQRLIGRVVENLDAFLAGTPQNVVNP